MQLALGGGGLGAGVGAGLGGAFMNTDGPSGRLGGMWRLGTVGDRGREQRPRRWRVSQRRRARSRFARDRCRLWDWAPGRAWTAAEGRVLAAREGSGWAGCLLVPLVV